MRKKLNSRNFLCEIPFHFSETDSWPVIYKSGEKQMANVLWHNEGLFVDLPFGYVDDLAQVYDSTGNTIQYRQKIKFPPKLYYPMMEIEQETFITKKNDEVLVSVANFLRHEVVKIAEIAKIFFKTSHIIKELKIVYLAKE